MTAIPTSSGIDVAAVRAALRRGAGLWIQRFYSHELQVARTVKGMELDAMAEFERLVVKPIIEQVASRLSTFDLRGQTITIDAYPQLRAMADEVNAIVRRGADTIKQRTLSDMGRIAAVETSWAVRSADEVLGIKAQRPLDSMVTRAVTQQPFLGLKVEEWFDKMLVGPTGEKARAFIQVGLQRGLTTDQIVRGLRGTKAADYSDGILTGQSAAGVATLVRTAASHASSVARMESFKAIGVDKWRFLATLDLKTCPRCRAFDGKVFTVGQGPLPPLHPNTRSTPVPWFGDPIGNRASVDGPVPADVDHEEWLRGLSISEQDQALGRRVGVAWRAGKLDYVDLIGPDLEPLTMKELEDRNLIRPR